MAKLPYGILGPPKGKLGGKVYTSWKGVAIVKDAPKKSKKKPTQLQLEQREKFGLLNAFFSVICDFIRIGFKGYSKKMTQPNAAIKLNSGVVTGTFPNFSIDYSKVLISSGFLIKAWNTQLNCDVKGKIVVSWHFDRCSEDGSDMAFALFYNESINQCYFSAGKIRRSAEILQFRKKANARNDIFHVWLFFRNSNKKEVSNSVYLGQV